MQFPIAIHKDHGSDYGVIVPDIAGCHSWGNTIDDAIHNAKEAIILHLQSMLDLGMEPKLTASSVEELSKNEEYTGAMWALVDVDLSSIDSKPERVNISLPRFVLRRIDQHVRQHHDTRSGFLARAAIDALANEQ